MGFVWEIMVVCTFRTQPELIDSRENSLPPFCQERCGCQNVGGQVGCGYWGLAFSTNAITIHISSGVPTSRRKKLEQQSLWSSARMQEEPVPRIAALSLVLPCRALLYLPVLELPVIPLP